MLRFLTSWVGRRSASLATLAFADGDVTACYSMISPGGSPPFASVFMRKLREPLETAVRQKATLSGGA